MYEKEKNSSLSHYERMRDELMDEDNEWTDEEPTEDEDIEDEE